MQTGDQSVESSKQHSFKNQWHYIVVTLSLVSGTLYKGQIYETEMGELIITKNKTKQQQ